MAGNVFGLVSGIDTEKLINAILSVHQLPIKKAEAQKAAVKTQLSTLGKLTSKLDSMQTTLEELDTMEEVLALKANTSDEEIVTVTADGSASPGTYDLVISNLAKAEKNRSTAYSSEDDIVAAGSLVITVGEDDEVTITIDEGDSIEEVVEKINASDAAVNAGLIFTGTEYYLQISALETGFEPGTNASNAIIIEENVTGGGAGTALSLTETTTAENAIFTLDGLSIESQSNSPSDVLPGVTFDLLQEGEGAAATITIDKDIDGTKEKVNEFISSFNDVMKLIQAEIETDEFTNRNKTLADDPVVRRLRKELIEFVTDQVENMTGTFQMLAEIGVTFDPDGKLAVDDDVLEEAIDTDIKSLGRIFTFADTGMSAGLTSIIETYTDEYDGFLSQSTDILEDRRDAHSDRIWVLEDRVSKMHDRLVRQYARMESTLSSLQTQGQALAAMLG